MRLYQSLNEMTRYRQRKLNETIKRGTLDQKHTDIMTKIKKTREELPVKRLLLEKHQIKLRNLQKISPIKKTTDITHNITTLQDTIANLEREIRSIESSEYTLDYVVSTLPILVDYYGNLDQTYNDPEEIYSIDNGKKNVLSYLFANSNMTKFDDQNICKKNNISQKNPTKNLTKTPTKNLTKNLTKTLTKNPTKNQARKTTKNAANNKNTSKNTMETEIDTNNCPILNDAVTKEVTKEVPKKMSRTELYDEYLRIMDPNYHRNSKKINICPLDGCDGEREIIQSDSNVVCKKCGCTEKILLITEKPNFKENTQEYGAYAYKRINHLTEILSQLQAKESTDIPQRVIDTIHKELKKRRIDKNSLDIFRLRRILKRLGYRKYYEHVPHILQIINGREPPSFSRQEETKIKQMFKDIQKPFAIYCPRKRKNFLNYSYVLHKICELLCLDKHVSYFPLLKNTAKLLQHDRIWKNICEYMKWKYYKSI